MSIGHFEECIVILRLCVSTDLVYVRCIIIISSGIPRRHLIENCKVFIDTCIKILVLFLAEAFNITNSSPSFLISGAYTDCKVSSQCFSCKSAIVHDVCEIVEFWVRVKFRGKGKGMSFISSSSI